MCDISSLLTFGVFGTKNTEDNSFFLYRSCDQIIDAFGQYCLIPLISRMASTCNTLEDQQKPEFLFQRAISGKLETLSQLPILFESCTQNTSQDTHIQLVSDIKDYMRPVSNIKSFMIFSNSGLICIAAAPQLETLQLLALDNAGILRPQRGGSTNELLQTSTADLRCNVFAKTDGSIKYALLDFKLYEQKNIGRWNLVVDANARHVLIDANVIILVTKNTVICKEPSEQTQEFKYEIIWSCLTQNQKHAIIGCFVSSSQTEIFIMDVTSGDIIQRFIAQSSGFNASTNYVYSACMSTQIFDEVSAMNVYVTNNITRYVQNITLSVATSQTSVAFLQNPIVKFYADLFINEAGRVQNNNTGQIFAASPMLLSQNNTLLYVNLLKTLVWVITSSGLVWELTLATDVWTQQSQTPLYFQHGSLIHDEQKSDVQQNERQFIPWYNGQSSFSIAQNLLPTSVIGSARHNRYRYVVANISIPPNNRFPVLQTRLERTNEFVLLMSPELYEVKLYDDANIIVSSKQSKRVIWSSNTHDKSNDPTAFKIWTAREFALSTVNGLYVLYCDKNSKSVKLSYNIFNNPRFTIFCKQSEEYKVRALEAQSAFCFQNLRTDNQIAGTVAQFADSRCACIGGQKLLENVFPAFAQKNSQTSGRLIANLPCLLSQCGASFLHGPELTNTYEYVSATCKGNLVVCSDIVEIGDDGEFNLAQFQLQQNCGKDPTACVRNEECPKGFICVDGRCVAACTSNVQCHEKLKSLFAVCDPNGRCNFPILPKVLRAISIWQIVALVCSALILIFIILLIAFFVKEKKSTKSQ